MFYICYIRYKSGSSRGKERMVEIIRSGLRWKVVIRLIVRVNIRLPIMGNVVRERVLIRRVMDIRWRVGRVVLG